MCHRGNAARFSAPLCKGRNSERLLWRMKRGISTAAVRERENSASRSVSGERQRGCQRIDDVWSVYSPFSRGSLTREREGGGCKNFSFTVLRLFFWLQKKRGKYRRCAGSTEEGCGAENMCSVYFGARLYRGVNSRLELSLPQSYCLNPLCSSTAPSSEGAEAAPAAEH